MFSWTRRAFSASERAGTAVAPVGFGVVSLAGVEELPPQAVASASDATTMRRRWLVGWAGCEE